MSAPTDPLATLKSLVGQSGSGFVKIGVPDIDGVLRGKYMSKEKFLASLDGGFGFCEVVLGWDAADQLYDNTAKTGWHSGYGDVPVRILPETARLLPTEPGVVFVLGEFTGKFETICPRGTLRRVLERAQDMGFSAKAACEYEFLVVQETADSLVQKGYRGLSPLGHGNFGYSVLRASVNTEFYHGLLQFCSGFDLPLEALHEETGPGALEAAIQVTDALTAADRGILFKTFAKVVAQRMGLQASFMAKWDKAFPGQGGHVHVSLQDSDGNGIFVGPDGGLSETMRHFIGGIRQLAPELAALAAPTVNSYRRLVPGYWAPTAATWGVDNRTVAVRAITGSPKSQRVEFRIPGADTNPYLSLAAALGAGLWGIENKIDPGMPMTGNAYTQDVGPELQLPRSLGEAAERLHRSTAARQIFGDDFVEHFAATRDWEEREFRRHVTDWELSRYFEII